MKIELVKMPAAEKGNGKVIITGNVAFVTQEQTKVVTSLVKTIM